MRTSLIFTVSLLLAAPAFAKGKAAAPAPAKKLAAPTASQARALTDLMGKFKWGMSTDDVFKVLENDLTKKYDELLAKEPDVYKQDQLRKQKAEEIEKSRASILAFDGKKSGWDVSIIDREFGHRNEESMLVLWESNQRRFLFFTKGKLYKQFIAFNAEHPAFAGKSFDDFGKILQDRYGQAELKFAALKTKDDMTLDHMEWPARGDTTLWAIDQSGFYGNFCIVLRQTTVANAVEKSRPAGSRPGVAQKGSALIDTVTKPPANNTDPNADIIDQITGRKPDGKLPASSSRIASLTAFGARRNVAGCEALFPIYLITIAAVGGGFAERASAQPLITARVYEEESGPQLAVELERGIGEALKADGRVQYRPYVDILVPRDQSLKNIAQAQTLLESADKAWEDLNVPVCKELLDQAYDILSRELTTLVEQPDGIKPVHDTLTRLARTTFLDGDQAQAREYLRRLYALHGSLAKDLFPPAMKKLVTEARLLYETLGTGKATLESDPAGAEVFFDGVRQSGVTPIELGDVIPGPHIVTFVRRGYAPTTTTVDVRGNGEKTPLFFTLERYPKNPLAPLDRARLKLGTEPPPLMELQEGATAFLVDSVILVRVIQREKESGGTEPLLVGFLYDRRADKLVAKIDREGTEAELVANARSLARDLIGELSTDGKYETPKPSKHPKKPVAKPSKSKSLNASPVPDSGGTPVSWYKKPLVWYIGGGVAGAIVLGAAIGIGVGVDHQRRERQLASDIALIGGGN